MRSTTLSKALTVAFKPKSVSQVEVAKRAGYCPQCLTNWKKGRSEPSIRDVGNVAEALGMRLSELIRLGEDI